MTSLEALGAGVAARVPDEGPGPRVLVVSLRAWVVHSGYESLIAQALRLRGSTPALLTCGGGLPICEVGWGRRIAPRPCDRCAHFTARVATASRMEHFRLSDELAWPPDPARAPAAQPVVDLRLDSLGLVDHSVAWVARSFDPASDPDASEIAGDFRVTEAAVEQAAERIIDRFAPDVIVSVNGLFAAERVITEVARRRNIRVCSYELAPRAGALLFSQTAPSVHFDTDDMWRLTRDRPLTPEQDQTLGRLLEDRASGVGAHESYFDTLEENHDALRETLGIAPGQRIVSLFTNVTWDSAVLRQHVGYASMLEWVESAVRFARDLPEIALVIRVHPADGKWGSRDEPQKAIARAVGELPPNVHFVGAEQPLSSYALLDISDTILAYATTVGLEAAARGKPVVVAGATHYRGRGFTRDIEGDDELLAAMTDPKPAMTDEQRTLARRYAFGFFFRWMVPFPPLEAGAGRVQSVTTDAAELERGRDPYLDFVCDRIIDGGPFILPDDLAVA
jgi:hypothetical protein